MRNKLLPFIMVLVLALALMSFGAVFAQDATPTLINNGENVEILNTLEDITADSSVYFGQPVTVEGVIEELVNVRTFVLGEGAALDDDKVLVINNTGQEFGLNITRDQRVRVTGTIYPSRSSGGFDQIGANSGTNPMMTDDAMMTTPMVDAMADATLTPMMSSGMIDWANFPLRDEFNDYTLLLLSSVDEIIYIQEQ